MEPERIGRRGVPETWSTIYAMNGVLASMVGAVGSGLVVKPNHWQCECAVYLLFVTISFQESLST